MADYDVFNGDADGLCALVQLRLAEPREATLVTGVKRDIALLKRVEAETGDRVTVLDISLDRNREELERLLYAGVLVTYIDHHYAGEIPLHFGIDATIDPSPETCTSLLVNGRLQGQYALWALTGAYGDNLLGPASRLAMKLGMDDGQAADLRELGTLLNYNGYGSTTEDLHFTPEALFGILSRYASPLDFLAAEPAVFERLRDGYREDLAQADGVEPIHVDDHVAVYRLPDADWARRVSGVFGNALSNRTPDLAHAVVTDNGHGALAISVRAPQSNRQGADTLCRQFASGGGRKGAAGINELPEAELDRFIATFSSHFAELWRG